MIEQLKLFPDFEENGFKNLSIDGCPDREIIDHSLKPLKCQKLSKIDETLNKSIEKYNLDKNFANFLKLPLPITDKEILEINKKDSKGLEEFYEKQVDNLTQNNFEDKFKLLQIEPTAKFAYSLSVLNKLSETIGQKRISYLLTFNPEDIINIAAYLRRDFFSILDKSELDSIKNKLNKSIAIKMPEKVVKIRSQLELIEKLITFDEFCTEIRNGRKYTVLSNFSNTYESSNGFIDVKFTKKGKNIYPPKGFPNKVIDGKILNIEDGTSSYIFVNPISFNRDALAQYIKYNRCNNYIVLISTENKYENLLNGLGAKHILYMGNRNYSEKVDTMLEKIHTNEKGDIV